jgi:hypothetical protein
MAQPLDLPALLELVRLSLQGTAKNAVHKFWGPDGPPWGTSFAELEQLALQLGQVVSREVLLQALQAQAAAAPEKALLCPVCGQPTTPADPEPHLAKTDVGEVTWSEPARTCQHCRKAFFPSVQEPGH